MSSLTLDPMSANGMQQAGTLTPSQASAASSSYLDSLSPLASQNLVSGLPADTASIASKPLLSNASVNLLESGLGTALNGYFENQGNQAAASTLTNSMSSFNNLASSISPADLQVALQQAGMTNYNPAVLQAGVNVAPSAYQNLGPNSQVMSQQMANNAALQGVASSGYTPEMLAAYNQMQNATNAQAQSNMAAIQQQQAARGLGSSGNDLALRMQAAQNATNAANTSTQQIAAQGFQNKLAAMQQLGSLTNAQQAQLSSLAAQQAQGLQQNSQYGTTLNADIASRNVAAQNQQQNLQTGTANQFSQFNTGIANQQAMQNEVNSKQQAFNDKLGALSGAEKAADALSKQQASNGSDMGSTVSKIAGTVLPAMF